jgi:hypothetical protein
MDQTASLEAFFQESVDRALREKGLPQGTLTEHYLVRLLTGYANQQLDDTPLAVKLLEALAAAPPKRRAQLREVGDTSLFVSGFFSESRATRLVDVDYYIGLGGSAYSELARASEGWSRDPYGDVYEELARDFVRFVEVLSAVSQLFMPSAAPQDIVRLYEKWRTTGSGWAARRLARLGVVTQQSSTKLQ